LKAGPTQGQGTKPLGSHRAEIFARFKAGATVTALARRYHVDVKTMSKMCREWRPTSPHLPPPVIKEPPEANSVRDYVSQIRPQPKPKAKNLE
jgi:transposase-like protein